jgi:hypothetical protein
MEFEGSAVGMPRVRHDLIPIAPIHKVNPSWLDRPWLSELIPISAIYRVAPAWSDRPWLNSILVLWEDGRCVWSEDPVRGGPPYCAGNVDQDRVRHVFAHLDAGGAFSAPARVRFRSRYSADSGHIDIAIIAGPRRLHMGADYQPPHPLTPGWDGEIDRQFCKLWSEVHTTLMGLCPDKGYGAGELEF